MTTPAPTAPNNPKAIRFTRYAFSKLEFIRDIGDTEVGGFGISHPDDPLLIEDFIMVKQKATAAFVEFDPEDLNAHMNRLCDAGIEPNRSIRVWIHTHPGNSASPSGVDEKCFAEEFANPDFAVMFILARGGQTYCRLKVNNGKMCLTRELETQIIPDAADTEAWEEEYKAKWERKVYAQQTVGFQGRTWDCTKQKWQEAQEEKAPSLLLSSGGDKLLLPSMTHPEFQLDRPLLPKEMWKLTKNEAQQYLTWCAGRLTVAESQQVANTLVEIGLLSPIGKATKRVASVTVEEPKPSESLVGQDEYDPWRGQFDGM